MPSATGCSTGLSITRAGRRLPLPRRTPRGMPPAYRRPPSPTVTFQSATPQVRTGQPLYLKDLNCHCFDPNNTFVLNPAAWTNPGPRSVRRPDLLWRFPGRAPARREPRLGTAIPNPRTDELERPRGVHQRIQSRVLQQPRSRRVGVSPQTAPVCKLPAGGNGACSQPGLQIVSGFGSINVATTAYPPRTGQLVAQFTF